MCLRFAATTIITIINSYNNSTNSRSNYIVPGHYYLSAVIQDLKDSNSIKTLNKVMTPTPSLATLSHKP